MPHQLSWASASNLNPSFTLKNGSLCFSLGTEKRNTSSAHQSYYVLVIKCIILPYFIFLTSSTPISSISTTDQPPRLWCQIYREPFSFLYSQCSEVVCYGGPVKAANTGQKPGGTLLNGWAVRKPVLWWRPRLHVGSDGIMSVPVNTTANGRLSCQWSPGEGGKSVESLTSLGLLGEYGLYLDLKEQTVPCILSFN